MSVSAQTSNLKQDTRVFKGFTIPRVPTDKTSQASLIWECADHGEAARARVMCDAERETAQRMGNASRIAAATRIHGELLALRGAGDVAQSEFLRALELVSGIGDREEEVRIRTALARVLALDGPFDEAEGVARSALDLASTSNDQRGRIQAMIAWGRAKFAQGEVKASVPLFFKAMRAARRSHDDVTLREVWVDLALALAKSGRTRTATRLLNSALMVAEQHNLKRMAMRAQSALAQTLLVDQLPNDALPYALSAISHANSYGYEGFLPGLYEQLADVYTQLNDYQGAFYAIRQQVDTQRRRMTSQRRHILMLSSLLLEEQSRG